MHKNWEQKAAILMQPSELIKLLKLHVTLVLNQGNCILGQRKASPLAYTGCHKEVILRICLVLPDLEQLHLYNYDLKNIYARTEAAEFLFWLNLMDTVTQLCI